MRAFPLQARFGSIFFLDAAARFFRPRGCFDQAKSMILFGLLPINRRAGKTGANTATVRRMLGEKGAMSDQRSDAKKGLPSYLRPAAAGAQKSVPQSGATTGAPSSQPTPVAPGTGRGLPAYLKPDAPRAAGVALAETAVEPVPPPGVPGWDALGLLRYAIAALCALAIVLVALSIEQRRIEADLAAKLRRVELGMTGKEVTETAGPGERTDEGKDASRICYAFPAWRLLPGAGLSLAGGRLRLDPAPRVACFRLSRDVVISRELPE